MNLLVDLGNTRLKWAITTGGQIIPGQPLLNDRVNRDGLVKLWQGAYRPRRLAVSCVGASQLSELVQTVARELWLDVDIILVKSQAQAFGVISAYPQPEKLGVDRWLSLIAVRQQYQGPACIVDCGTAITVDLIDDKGHHQGGLICPGLALMKKSLALGTQALQCGVGDMPPSLAAGLACSTEAAIYNGTLIAAIGLIGRVMAKQPKNTRLILTGGDAQLIAGQLDVAATVVPELVLQGLLCVLEGHA